MLEARLALPSEAEAIAACQRRVWATDTPDLARYLPRSLDEIAVAWESAITKPPLAQFRVWVAVGEVPGSQRGKVVGYCAVGPSPDEDAEVTDAEIGEFAIDPSARGQGHGSRLLNAVAGGLAADGFETASIWLITSADQCRSFFTAAGFAADGAHRVSDSVNLKQVRLTTRLAE